MEKKSFVNRLVIQVTIVLAVMVGMSIIYFHLAWRIDSGNFLRPVITTLSAWMLFISIGFGTLYIYPTAFFRGASAGERIIACLVTPVVWNIKEMVRVSEFFSLGETLYYGLNTSFLLAFFGTFGLMGLCELICRGASASAAMSPSRYFPRLRLSLFSRDWPYCACVCYGAWESTSFISTFKGTDRFLFDVWDSGPRSTHLLLGA